MAETGHPRATTRSEVWVKIVPSRAEEAPEAHRRRRWRIERLLATSVPVVLIVLWQIATTRGWIEGRYFPSPTQIVSAWDQMIDSGLYWRSLTASVQRIGLGYLLGASSALAIGLAVGSVRTLRVALEPTMVALYTVPKLSILPLLLLIFGLGETTKILLVALTAFFVILLNTIDAVAGVSKQYTDVGRACGASRMAILRHIIFPAALPQVLTGLRLAAGLAVIVIVGAEFVAADAGLGYLVWNSWNLGVPERMYVGIVSIAALGVAANAIIRLIERLLVPWAPKTAR